MEYKTIIKKLTSIMDKNQAEAEFNLILDFIGFNKKDLWLDKIPTEEQTQSIQKIIKKRIEERMPIQHILGYGYFMGEKFLVSKDVLIPRPETELLVEKISEIKGDTVLDIGTGSGCIAIMAAKLSKKIVTACDISKEALTIAQKNAENLGTDIKFIQSDLFENISNKFDIIVSNPPYIPLSEHHALMEEVKEHEPNLALFASDEKGIEFYEKISREAIEYLNPNGHIAFEIGIGQENHIKNILENYNFEDIKILKDFAKINRIIIAKAPK